jgi:two-component system LytT family response regulator
LLQGHDSQRLRVLVVDDEPLARGNLKVLLRDDTGIEWVRECGGGVEALAAIRSFQPDLVFLDVQMPEVDGFKVIEALDVEAPVVIFVTAYDEHAIRAFDAGAIDYLLKPFDNIRFALALSRARERIAARRVAAGKPTPVAVKELGRIVYIEQDDIEWIEAADYYVCVHVAERSHLLRRSMTELERELDEGLFSRVHRSVIVNLSRVRALELGDSDCSVVLKSGTRLPLSRRYRKQVQARLAAGHQYCWSRPRTTQGQA